MKPTKVADEVAVATEVHAANDCVAAVWSWLAVTLSAARFVTKYRIGIDAHRIVTDRPLIVVPSDR